MVNHQLAFELLSDFSLNRLEILFSNDPVMLERIMVEKTKRSNLHLSGPVTQFVPTTSSYGSLL